MAAGTAVSDLLARLDVAPGATAMALDLLVRAASRSLPSDYLDVMRWSDGFEGYLAGRSYVRVWSAANAVRFNREYQVAELAPGLFLFGSDAAAIGYGFDLAAADSPVVSVELSALHRQYVEVLAASFTGLLERLASRPLDPGEAEEEDHRAPDWLKGHVIHEKKPVALGGSVEDQGTRALVPEDVHPQLTVFWSRVIHRQLRERESQACQQTRERRPTRNCT